MDMDWEIPLLKENIYNVSRAAIYGGSRLFGGGAEGVSLRQLNSQRYVNNTRCYR